MLIRMDGNVLAKNVLPLTARQVTWFIDPEALLRHLGDLHTLKLAAYCKHCYERGLPEDVTATFNPEKREWAVRCACAEYPPIIDRGDGVMHIRKQTAAGMAQIVVIASVDELLFRLGWSFKCVGECARLGMNDGVQGDNDPAGKSLKVICGCTERVYAETVH